MSVTQGGQIPGHTGANPPAFSRRQRPDAAEARDRSSGDQKQGGGHLRVAGSEPRRVVVMVGLGVAGAENDEL